MRRITEISPAEEARIVDAICAMHDTVQDRSRRRPAGRASKQGLYELLHRGRFRSQPCSPGPASGSPPPTPPCGAMRMNYGMRGSLCPRMSKRMLWA